MAAGPPTIRLALVTTSPQPGNVPPAVQELIRAPGSGEPLSLAVQAALETSLEVPLRPVRVHTDARTAAAVDNLGARAFTYGLHIFLGSRERATDLELMAHEATHVVQQQGRPILQLSSPAGASDAFEHEAHQTASAVRRGERAVVQGRTDGARVQGIWPADEIADWAEDKAWRLLNDYVPELVPIIRQGPEGVFDWIKNKVMSAIEGLFNNFLAPVLATTGVGKWLSRHFGPLLTWMQEAAAKIARNDCSPLQEAADKIEQVATSIITPVVEKIRAVAEKVGGFFKGLWEKFGAPVWDWIKEIAGQQWEQLQQLATWIWDKTAPVRRILSRAWTWLKNKLGIGEGPEGQNGILQWVQRKVEAAWEWVKVRIEPYKKQLLAVAGVIGGITLLLSPAGPVLMMGGIIVGVVQGVRWIKANWGKGNLIVQARTYLEKTLIPAFIGSLNQMTAAVARIAGALNGKLGELAAGMGWIVSAVAGSILHFAVAAMQWMAEQITDLAQWGSEKLQALARWIQTGFTRLVAFLQPVLDFLGQVARVVLDIWSLPLVLAGRLWNLIPACIRDPVVDFIIPIMLRQISIFQELVRDNEAWQKTKADVLRIIRLVFKDHDLMGALKAVFNLILRVFNVPVELAIQVTRKAASAWDAVMEKPIAFIKNAVRAIAHGFKLLWQNRLKHLAFGVEGWLFGELADKGIHPPASWTNPMDLLGFVVEVLGLSMNHIFELLKKRFDPAKVAKLQVWYGRLKTAWNWIQEIIDPSRSPADVTKGLIDRAKDFGKSILEGVVEWIAGKVAAELAAIAVAAAASAGLSEIIDIARRIYKAIQTAVRWMRKILEMVNTVLDSILDIVRGNIEPAGEKIEAAMHRAMPVVISFLGDQVGLGGIGVKMRELVDKLRAKVDEAILWLIDKVKAMLEALVRGVKGVLEWWKKPSPFKSDDGKDHSIYVQGEPSTAEIIVESKRTYLSDLISKIKDADLKEQAQAKQRKIREIIASGRDVKDEKDINPKAQELEVALEEMGKILVKAKVLEQGEVPPAPEYHFSTTSDGKAHIATVSNLSAIRPMGSPPLGGEEPKAWEFLQDTRQTTGEPYFRQMHLINKLFGGPGIRSNLAPGAQAANSDHLYNAENKLKEIIGAQPNSPGKTAVVLSYRVQVNYYSDDTALDVAPLIRLSDFPREFECTWEYVDQWPKGKQKPTPDGYTVPEDKFHPPRPRKK